MGSLVCVGVTETERQFKIQLFLVEVCVTTALRKGEFASAPLPHSIALLSSLADFQHRSVIK